MPARSPRTPSSARTGAAPTDVDALLARLEHPLTPVIHRLRAIIRDVDPRITESIKWNAPSFATAEHFATFHLRAADAVQVVLHLGAKARPDAALRDRIADPESLLQWRGADRATATFRSLPDVDARRAAFAALIRQWITFVS